MILSSWTNIFYSWIIHWARAIALIHDSDSQSWMVLSQTSRLPHRVDNCHHSCGTLQDYAYTTCCSQLSTSVDVPWLRLCRLGRERVPPQSSWIFGSSAPLWKAIWRHQAHWVRFTLEQELDLKSHIMILKLNTIDCNLCIFYLE